MRALELLGITPALVIAAEKDPVCLQVIKAAWPRVVLFDDVQKLTGPTIGELLAKHPKLRRGLFLGGPPCQELSSLKKGRTGVGEPRKSGIYAFKRLIEAVLDEGTGLNWQFLMENVARYGRGRSD